MATRRSLATLTRHFRSLLHSQTLTLLPSPPNPTPSFLPPLQLPFQFLPTTNAPRLHFSSQPPHSSDEEDYDEQSEEDEENCNGAVSKLRVSGKTAEEKLKEAEEIGYRVVGPLDSSENPFKPWEPVFAVVQIGSHQFKVSNGDSIFTERLKFCDVNDKLVLNKVLMLGSKAETVIGRPILPDAAVHAVVEEHALDAKVIIFKKKRRKNYRRTKGHRQELTKLRITDIQGIQKSGNVAIAA